VAQRAAARGIPAEARKLLPPLSIVRAGSNGLRAGEEVTIKYGVVERRERHAAPAPRDCDVHAGRGGGLDPPAPSLAPPPSNLALGAAVQAARAQPHAKSPLAPPRAPSAGRPSGVHTIAASRRASGAAGPSTAWPPTPTSSFAASTRTSPSAVGRRVAPASLCAGNKFAKVKVVGMAVCTCIDV